jgi:N-acetylglucosamine-6-phosphate deacetylase
VSDGVHVDPSVIAFTYRVFGPSRCVCITDGMRTVGLPDGRYTFNGLPGESRAGTARYLDGTLIGTALGLSEVVRRFRAYTGCPLAAALDAASRLPAAVLGLAHRKGRIAAGFDADLVLFDDDLNVFATVVGGEVVYRSESS